MMDVRRRCTCAAPVPVDLMSGDGRSLFRNLESYGWSPVRVDVAKLRQLHDLINSGEAVQSLLRQHDRWKDWHAELFAPIYTTESHVNVTYVTAESGSATDAAPEAKESWEDPRRYMSAPAEGGSSLMEDRMRAWTEIFHAIAVQVRKELDFPKHILLHECDQQNETSAEQAPLDLLRCVYYEPSRTRPRSHPTLGSSPHTDWGSFTVVWQDTVSAPCLQTYCHIHDSWNDVETHFTNDFVVHVGDLTSLALQTALQSSKTSADGVLVWPSPRHRVVSPVDGPRSALVYFCYPPGHVTATQMAQGLAGWCEQRYANAKSTATHSIPYDDFFLLRDQSAKGTTSTEDAPVQRWLDMAHLPIAELLRDKWRQVQR